MALTKDRVFFDAFTAHASKSVAAAGLLVEMLDDLERVESLAAQVTELEHHGDKITHDCVAALHQTWITPLDREEIYALITRLDDVLDCIEAASERILLFEIKEPTAESKKLAKAVVAACKAIESAVSMLSDIKHAPKLLALCVEINKLENEADRLYRGALASLFKPGNDPLFVMKWRDIYDYLEVATDRGEDVANIIEGIVLEHA